MRYLLGLLLTLTGALATAQTPTLPPVVVQGTNIIERHAIEQEQSLKSSVRTCIAMDTGNEGGADSSTNGFEAAEKYAEMAQCTAAEHTAETHVVELCKGSQNPTDVVQACTVVLDMKLVNPGFEYLPLADRAEALIVLGDYQDALKDLNGALQQRPDYAIGFYLRADARVKLGTAGAMADLQKAVSMNPALAQLVIIKGKTVTLQLPRL